MNPIALLLLAFAMSTDAFAAAIGKGASLKNPSFSEALRMGVIFGSIEAITPVMICKMAVQSVAGIATAALVSF